MNSSRSNVAPAFTPTDLSSLTVTLLPPILGLACAKACLDLTSFGRFNQTDGGTLSEVSTLLSLALFGILFLITAARKPHLSQTQVENTTALFIVFGTVVTLALFAIQVLGVMNPPLRVGLSGANAFLAAAVAFYWLRRLKGAPNTVTVIAVFGAIALSEIFDLFMAYAPDVCVGIASIVCMPVQFLFLRLSRGIQYEDIPFFFEEHRCVFINDYLVNDAGFLISNAFGIGLFAIVVGFVCGYPDGLPIVFTPATRALCTALTALLCITLIAISLRGSGPGMSAVIWPIMQLCVCAALITFAAFPAQLHYGAVFASAATTLFIGFTWYLIAGFESFGWRDPSYYACAGWVVCLGFKSIARLICLSLSPISGESLIVDAIVATLLVMNAQVIFLRYVKIVAGGADEADEGLSYDRRSEGSRPEWLRPDDAETAAPLPEDAVSDVIDSPYARELMELMRQERTTGESSFSQTAPLQGENEQTEPHGEELENRLAPAPAFGTLERIMGVDGRSQDHDEDDLRQDDLKRRIRMLGNHFMLSEREIEVLELYAQGHTQKHVAQQLYISQETAHTHIKRIYAKTGLHSRQNILDYLDEYCL